MAVDERVLRRYEATYEDARLWRPGIGDLVRLRTWDVFARFLPGAGIDGEDHDGERDGGPFGHASGVGRATGRGLGRVADVGGGPGTHAAHLAGRGYEVVLVDPVARHTELAASRSRSPSEAGGAFRVVGGEASGIPLGGGGVDAVLLMGPLYHLVLRSDRVAALREALRVLRPGGLLVAEVISRHAWILDATMKKALGDERVWDDFDRNVRTGLSQDPAAAPDGGFWAYFHTTDE
nr:class I SAM-dependent methyltransferase [Micromonospora sp. DSM 115978]